MGEHVDGSGRGAPAVRRQQALAFRVAAQALDRRVGDPSALGVLDLGIQDTGVASALVAFAARVQQVGDVLADPAFALVWSFRGAPHVHRRADLAALAAALWPVDDRDATARLGAERAALREAGIGGLEAFLAVSSALRATVVRPMVKGEVSAGVTARIPAALTRWCEGCGSTHVHGGIFQQAGLFAGVALEPGTAPAVLAPLEEPSPLPPPAVGPQALVRAYLHLHGPATPGEAAAHLGTTKTAIRSAWPTDLAEVDLEGGPAWIAPEDLDALLSAAAEELQVRLLPPADPFLQARDRDLVVPGRQRRKSVWRAVGSPGAVLVGAEVAGTWRAALVRRTLGLTVRPFERLGRTVRAALEAEAERVAAVRGAEGVAVTYDEG